MKNKIFTGALLFIVLCLSANTGSAQSKSVMKQYRVLPYTGMAKILVRVPGPQTFDSVYFKNGVAVYHQDKYDGEIGWLYATDVDRNMVHYMILEKGTITITATTDSLIFITGTPNNDALFTLDREIEPLRMKMKTMGREVMKLRSMGEKEKADKLQEELLEVSKSWWDKQTKFATTNTNLAGLNYVNKLMSRFTTDELKTIMKNYVQFADKNAYKSVQRRYQAEVKTDVGVVPPPFTLVSDKGEKLSLSGLRKKLTIVDFWASWCKPCRAENPNLIRLYSKWKDQGLEIVSVSIDKVADKVKWLDAIKVDGLTWLQVWDENGTTNKDYGITAIPRTFLLDESGKIVSKDLRGEELNRFVEEYLTKK
jgi:thiol-disulfide isomerase/thioredoxin